MLRGTFNYPDLDVLDSPLMSPTPLTGFLSGVPGSALAERIFNDPESWGDDDDDYGDFPEDVDGEQLAWLAEELEKVRGGKSAGVEAFDVQTPTEKGGMKLIATPPVSGVPPFIRRDAGAGWKGIGNRRSVRPISLAALFEHSDEDFSGEIQQQLSKILESGGIPHHIRPYPHSSALSPPSTSGTSSSLDSPLQIQTASLVATSGSSGEISPSPVTIYSASATLSFLEWYGIYPDSPRLDLNGRRSIMLHPPKSARQKTPMLQVPSPRHAARRSSVLDTPVIPPSMKRASSVPPPGLDIPADVSSSSSDSRATTTPPVRTRSPEPMQPRRQPTPPTQQQQPTHSRSESGSSISERGRPWHTSAPPPYTQTQTQTPPPHPHPHPHPPHAPMSRSNSGASSVAHSRDGTPPPRRLPSIPPPASESATTSRSSTPPHQSQSQPQGVHVHVQPAPAPTPTHRRTPSRTARTRTSSPAPAPMSMSNSTLSLSYPSRPLSSIRSPQGGPAGPRTRSRGSRDSAGGAPGNNSMGGLGGRGRLG
ncbi:hypothetical protein BDZ97DRAFT_1756374 [Flammula alnicola]|nr:hypothetical protein BDZ97DRAFT_1756374 [Flammula alnicola]